MRTTPLMTIAASLLGLAVTACAATPSEPTPSASGIAPVTVMIVGSFHMANPGHDLHNSTVEDVLQPAPQRELARINESLLAFRPSKVMAEWSAERVRERYAQYRAGSLAPSRNEVVQLGFRLAGSAGLDQVYGIDVDGDFPYEPVQAYAREHGQSALLDALNADIERDTQYETRLLQSEGIAATLRWLNEPTQIRRGHDFYRALLHVGAGTDQPGAALLTAWTHRNLLICANLIQNTVAGDRVVVFYGAGHAFLLRQCVTENPGFVLVEPNDYLPRSGEAK